MAMKNKEKETSGEEGWTIVKNKKAASAGKSRSVLNKNGFCCWIEAKGFSITKGFGSKSGKIQIIESKGERFSTLWVNYKGLDWFRKGLMLEITKSWSKSQSWHFNDSDEWLSATRGRNNNGEFIKLSGPNSWGNTVDLYFPSGSNGEGWKKILTLINQLIKPIESQTVKIVQPVPKPLIANPNLWSSKINLLSNEEVENINTSWILVSGVPFLFGIIRHLKLLGANVGVYWKSLMKRSLVGICHI
ncbi:hypothetical protein MKW92_047576 [Papaver armeniacum]|nr:hypothetical protein MKW92_047576 [Papaver armeniacum]